MIILVLVGFGFWHLAKIRDLVPFLWSMIGAASYFLGQTLAIYSTVWLAPAFMSGTASYFGVSIAGGTVATLIAWLALERHAKG